MKKYTFLFFLGLVASLFTACSDDDNLTYFINPAPKNLQPAEPGRLHWMNLEQTTGAS